MYLTRGISQFKGFSGLGEFNIDEINAALNSAGNAGFDVGDTSLTASPTDSLINTALSAAGQQKELAFLDVFKDPAKEAGLWKAAGEATKNDTASKLIQTLGPVAGALVKQAIPPLPTDLQGALALFNQAKVQRDNQLNQQVAALDVNVKNQVATALAIQKKATDAKFAEDRAKWQQILTLQQKKIAAARAVRDISQDRKTSSINEELAKKEQYKNIAIGVGISLVLVGGVYLFVRSQKNGL